MSHLLLVSKRELSRLEVLQQLSERRLTQRAVALRLSLSTRQVRRLAQAYKESALLPWSPSSALAPAITA